MLPITLDLTGAHGRTGQIVSGLRDLIVQGVLRPGEAVPSTRQLAAQLGVSRGTVVTAYDQLTAESYLIARPGAPTRVHPQAGAIPAGPASTHARSQTSGSALPRPSSEWKGHLAGTRVASKNVGVRTIDIDLRPQHSRQLTLDDPVWRAAWRRAATAVPGDLAGQGAPHNAGHATHLGAGQGQLREAIAEHLRLTRSMLVDPDQIMVTAGAREGLDLVLAALETEVEPLAVESPGYPGLHRLLGRRKIVVVPTAADHLGIQPDRLEPGARSVLVTPNHLYPRGGSMPAPRRLELLRRAQGLEALVIEDDYDSDFRHLDAPLPSLWELAPQLVIHLGTFHQVLTPEAHIGYLIAPNHLLGALKQARSDVGGGASPITQRAVADYLRSGGLRRHLARRRRDLLRRRALVRSHLDAFDVLTESGTAAVLMLSDSGKVQALVAACAQEGIALSLIEDYWLPQTGGQSTAGCLINYAHAPLPDLVHALKVVAALATAQG